MAHYWHTPPIAEIEEQIRWEMSGVERGAKRVRDQMAEQKVGEGEVGLKLMRRVAPSLIERITAAQEEAKAGLASTKRGRPPQWWWLILSLPADQLAVITLKMVLNEKPRDFTFHMPVVNIAANISRATWTQVDYERWKEAEGEKDPEDNEFLHYLRRVKQVDEKSFKKFSERIQRQKLEKWDHPTGLNFGVKMVDLLTEAAPDWFSVETNRLRGGRMEAQLIMSEEAKESIADITEQSELNRPMLLPMITPPADWRVAA
jgi:hypothetical protein